MGRNGWRLLLLGAVALQGILAWRATRFDRLLREGRRAYDAGAYQQAVEAFDRARSVQDDDPEVWSWQGDAADALGRAEPASGNEPRKADALNTTAWAGYVGAVLRSPLDTWSWCGMAETALRRAELLDREHGVDLAVLERRSRGILDPWRAIAFAAAKTALAIKPSGFQELDVLSRVYRTSGQLAAARDAMVRSARMMPSPSFHDWGAGDTFVEPLYKALMEAMREGVSQAPAFEHSGIHRDIGRFALIQGDLEGALAEMRAAEATKVDAEELYQAQRGEAQVLERMGSIDEAIRVWDAIILGAEGTERSDPNRRQRGILLRRVNRNGEACLDLREAVRDEPHDEALRVFASSACEAAGELDTAERLLRDGFVAPIDSPGVARALIDFCLRAGKRSSAEGLLRSWTRDFPEREEYGRWLNDVMARQP